MEWKKYEIEVFEALSVYYIDDIIEKDKHILGQYSKRQRQIDIFIEQKINDKSYITIIDCKNYNKKINVKTVESFISMVDDIGGDYGIMISEIGFTKSALNRAFNNPKNIELDIFDFKEITHHLQGESGMPYSNNNMTLIHAPFSWIVDAKKTNKPALCFLYKRGLTLEEAFNSGEFAYINYWDTKLNNISIRDLSRIQESNITIKDTIESIEFINTEHTLKNEAIIRIIKIINYPFIEITGFIKFNDFIFFCVCNTKEFYLKRNLRKMELLLKYVLPLKIKN
jgi:Restriction endonuclease